MSRCKLNLKYNTALHWYPIKLARLYYSSMKLPPTRNIWYKNYHLIPVINYNSHQPCTVVHDHLQYPRFTIPALEAQWLQDLSEPFRVAGSSSGHAG